MSFVYFSADQGTNWVDEAYFGMIVQAGNVNDLAGPVEDVLINIPGRIGAVQFPSRRGPRPIKLPVAFPFEMSQREMQSRARTFAAFLFDTKGFPRDLWLRFDYDVDKFYTVRYTGSSNLARDLMTGSAEVQFTARDPDKYLMYNAGEINWGSELMWESTIRWGDEFSFAVSSSPKTVEVNNFGVLEVAPVIKIVGSFSTLTISIGDDDLVYGEALVDATLTIDCAKFSAKVGDTNKNSKVSGDWLVLPPGVNNVTFTGTGFDFTVDFIFRPKFI